RQKLRRRLRVALLNGAEDPRHLVHPAENNVGKRVGKWRICTIGRRQTQNLRPAGLGTIKILDLGLARFDDARAAKGELPQPGQVLGPADYMALEKALDTHAAAARADIYRSDGKDGRIAVPYRPPAEYELTAVVFRECSRRPKHPPA